MTIKQQIRKFICDNFYIQDQDLPDDIGLIPAGLVDSTGFLEVVAFVEDAFGFAEVRPGIRTPDADLTEANWGGVDRMVEYVRRRIAAETATGVSR